MLDKTKFKIQTHKEASQIEKEWLERPVEERLRFAYELSLRAYGLDPQKEHPLDRTCFQIRKLEK